MCSLLGAQHVTARAKLHPASSTMGGLPPAPFAQFLNHHMLSQNKSLHTTTQLMAYR